MERTYYSLNYSQQSCFFQYKFTFSKNLINILSSVSFEGNADWDVMEKAFNLSIERNDCMRLRFEKVGKEIKQYFIEHDNISDIPRLKFKTKEEFDSFVDKKRKKAIPFMKGVVIEPYFINNYDGTSMVFFKVCHLIMDLYAIGVFLNDLMAVYKALTEKTELPKLPGSFEALLQKDTKKINDPELYKKEFEFYDAWVSKREMPQYSGFHGDKNLKWKAKRLKGVKFFMRDFLHDTTHIQTFVFEKPLVSKIVARAQSTGQSVSVFMNYCYAVAASMINGYPKHLYVQDICNCRGTVLEKTTCGTKAKNNVAFPDIDWDKSFDENIVDFADQHNEMIKHINFSDVVFVTKILHKYFKYPALSYIESYCFSLIAFDMPDGFKVDLYSNEKTITNWYIAQVWDVRKNEISCAYDYQKTLIKDEDMESFHKLYEQVVNKVLDNPDKPLKPLLEGLKESSGF